MPNFAVTKLHETMKSMTCLAMIMAAMTTGLCACTEKMERTEGTETQQIFTRATRISTVMNDPAFGDWGRLIFPVDEELKWKNTPRAVHAWLEKL